MKKLLALAFASIAVVAVASSYSPTIGVTKITTTSVNTIIPIPYTSLSSGVAVSLADLVCTTNLPANTWLLAFDGDKYEAWTLLTAGGTWTSGAYATTIPGVTVAQGAGDKTFAAGGAFWIVLPDEKSIETAIYVLGAYSDSVTSTITAGKTMLVANPLQEDATATIANAAANDQIVVINGATVTIYTYNGTKWGQWVTSNNGLTFEEWDGILPYGAGFWYKSKGATNVTITWSASSQSESN